MSAEAERAILWLERSRRADEIVEIRWWGIPLYSTLSGCFIFDIPKSAKANTYVDYLLVIHYLNY